MCDKDLRYRREESLAEASFTKSEIARILLEQHRIREVTEEVAGSCVGKISSVALGVALHSLPIPQEGIRSLSNPRLNRRQGVDVWVGISFQHEIELPPRR